MDCPEGDDPFEPFVFLDDEEAPPPRRRFPWLWGALAGALLLTTLGAAAFFHTRKPTIAPPTWATAIPLADGGALAQEAPSPPAETAGDDPPATPPPIAPKTPTPTLPVPEPPPAKAEVPVIADPPPPEAEKVPVVRPPPAPERSLTSETPPAPAASDQEDSVPVEKELASASAAIGDAKPLLAEVADRFDPPTFRGGDILDLAAKMDRVEEKLKDAERVYARVRERVPDPRILDRRRETIRDLLESLREGRARIRVPLSLRRAEVLREEAVPLAKEALDGFQPFSREAQVLDVRAEVASGKLRESRRLYRSVQEDAPDPERVEQCVKGLNSLLEALESRFPEATEAR